jgi:hypothetical protein
LIYPISVNAQSLRVAAEGDQLRIAAPQLRLLTKDAMDRLHDGASVAYALTIAVSSTPDGAPLDQMTYRFIFSYDLWEEKFAVTRLEPSPRAISHLTAAAAEAWCLDALVIRVSRLNADRPFWLTLTYRAEAPAAAGGADDSGFTLGGLVDIFSRPNRRQQMNGSRKAGPFRLTDLRRR